MVMAISLLVEMGMSTGTSSVTLDKTQSNHIAVSLPEELDVICQPQSLLCNKPSGAQKSLMRLCSVQSWPKETLSLHLP